MSARSIVYKDWVMSYGKKNKVKNFWYNKSIN
jgi:hypothetical protein